MSERIYQVIIGVLVLVILVGGALMVSGNRGSEGSSMSGDTSGTSKEGSTADVDGETAVDTSETDMGTAKPSAGSVTSGTPARGDSVDTVDQGAAKVAIASSVTLSKLGWVAVRDANEWILGAERLTAGSHKDVAITLLRGMEAGKTYQMVLYHDDGDMAFDLHKDSLVKKSDGSDVSAAFLAK